MKRIFTLLLVAMAFIGVVAQGETPTTRAKARVEPEEMHFACLVGETVVDTFYVYNLSASEINPLSAFGSDHGYIWTESVHGPIPPGGVGKGIVTYTPEQAGSHHGSLSMNIGGEFYGVEFYGEATEPTEQTAMPTFEYTYDDEYYTVTAYGDGEVKLYYEGEEVENPYMLPRTLDDYTAHFSATAKEPGKLISEMVYFEFYVEPIMPYILPMPQLVVDQVDDFTYYINVFGEGELHLIVNGQEMGIPLYIESTFEDQVLDLEAYATADESNPSAQESEHVTRTIVIPAMEKPVMPVPTIAYTVDEYDVTIIAQGEGVVTLYINGEEVENPCILPRTDEDYVVEASACASMEGYLESWYFHLIEIPAMELLPTEQTLPPTFQGTVLDGGSGYMVEINNSEPEWSDIYYRVFVENGNVWVEPSEWIPYEEPLTFTEPGHYRVEAFACTPGKTQSITSAIEFVVVAVTGCYDFEENGIFYKITDDSSVSVTCETTDYNSYSGQVSIPNTVTHEGVTYMVTAISENAFRNCEGLTVVTIGDYVTAVGTKAFWNCHNLTSIVLGDYVTTVGDEAFGHCSSLARVILGKGIRSLGRDAFRYCPAITDVTCRAAIPPVMANEATFSSSVYSSATLHVYPPVARNYAAADYWSNFGAIVGEDAVNPSPNDVNGDGRVDITDVVNLIDALLNN